VSLRDLQTICGSRQQHPCLNRAMGGACENPDFAKQNDRNSAALPLTDIPTKLLKQGLDVPPRQTAAYGTGEDQLKGALVLPLDFVIILPPGASQSFRLTAGWMRITLPLSGRQGAWAGGAESWWWPVHSKGLFAGNKVQQVDLGKDSSSVGG
jgi:hypothetical protein